MSAHHIASASWQARRRSRSSRTAATPVLAALSRDRALSLLLGAGGRGLTHVVAAGTIGGTLISQLMWANLVVGGFNLLPGLPLDGGRMLRAVIWKVTGRPGTSTIAAAWAGRVLALGLFVLVLAPPVEARIGGGPGLGVGPRGDRRLLVDG